ncbi:hypothetical protein MRX96_011292 [Rhipicephalus microplus]
MFRRTSTPTTPQSPSSPRRESLGSPSHHGRSRQLPVHEPYKEPPCVRRGMQVLSTRQYDLHIHSARGFQKMLRHGTYGSELCVVNTGNRQIKIAFALRTLIRRVLTGPDKQQG